MGTLKKTGPTRAISVLRFLGVLALLQLLTSCGAHYDRYAATGLQPVALENGLNRKEDARFWSGVKPFSTLPESHYKMGLYYQKSGQHELAVKEFLKAIDLDKTYVQAYNGLGMAYDALKDCTNAEQAYKTALLHASKLAYLFNNYGYSRLLCNDPDLAIRLFNRAAELDPTTARIRNNLLLAQLRFHRRIPETHRLSGTAPPAQPPVQSLAAQPVSRPKPAEAEIRTPPEIPAGPVASRSGKPFQVGSSVRIADGYSQSPGSNPAEIKPDSPSVALTGAKALEHVERDNAAPVAINKAAPSPVIAPGKRKKYPESLVKRIPQDLSFCDIEISNGNGVTGMAGRSAGFFRILGFDVGRITNAPHFNYQTSRIYYLEGNLDVAKAVAGIVPGPQEFEEVEDLGRAGIGVRLLLGRDMAAIRFPANLAGMPGDGEAEGRTTAKTVAVH